MSWPRVAVGDGQKLTGPGDLYMVKGTGLLTVWEKREGEGWLTPFLHPVNDSDEANVPSRYIP